MATSYNLAANPIWYFTDLSGKPLIGGKIYFYSSDNPVQLKLVYQDPAGLIPWPDPVTTSGDGSAGPFYLKFDDTIPTDLYYIRVEDADGNLIWDINNFIGQGGTGGSSSTTAVDLENLVLNNVFWRNSGTSVTPLPTSLNIAPGAHAGYGGLATPDIYFIKNNTDASDQISFPTFTTGGNPLTGDTCPVDYLQYDCNNTPSGETAKYIKIPVCAHLQNLSNQQVTITMWAKLASAGADQISFSWLQYYGEGASSAGSQITAISPAFTLTTSWQKLSTTTTIPNNNLTIGECGNDALYLLINLPLGAACHIALTKPSVYLGDLFPAMDFHTYDDIDAQINSPRTGSITTGYLSAPLGYVAMNDGSIGSSSSGATTRAKTDTYPLYYLIWNQVSNSWAPIQDSGGTPTTRGASAAEDFQANKRLVLPRQLGRALAASGQGSGLSNWALGEYTGNENTTLTQANLPSGNLTGTSVQGQIIGVQGAGSTPVASVTSSGSQQNSNLNLGGSSTAFTNLQPTVFQNVFIKL